MNDVDQKSGGSPSASWETVGQCLRCAHKVPIQILYAGRRCERCGGPLNYFQDLVAGEDKEVMWCDGLDIDLPTVIPGIREVVGELADVRLVVNGGSLFGTLNHPSVWNTSEGRVAFFALKDRRPRWTRLEHYWTDEPEIECTYWQALRDAWLHSYVLTINGVPIWDMFSLAPEMWKIMYAVRGLSSDDVSEAVKLVRESIEQACVRLTSLLHSGTQD